jgi:hypothetical protein
MAEEVSSFRNFLDQLEKLKGKRNLFAIILYDERPTCRAIGKFFSRNSKWLDSLSNASKMTVFIYYEAKPQSKSKGKQNTAADNPSLKIAHMFKIQADQLPGIVFFTLSEFKRKGTGVFLPLDTEVFERDGKEAEQFVSQVFGIIQKCQPNQQSDQTLLRKIRAEMNKLSNVEKMKPVLDYLRQNLKSIGNVPSKFFEKLAEALGVAIAGFVIKGPGQT